MIALIAVQSMLILILIPASRRHRMASLTIRKLDEHLKKRLRLQAARHGRSMEEEARLLLAAGLKRQPRVPDNVADAIAAIVDPIGGIELDLPPRSRTREPPRFDDWPDDT
jgi:plasmid stability protein